MDNNEVFRKTLASWLLIHDPASVKRSNNKGNRKQHVCPTNISVPRTWHIFRWFRVHGQTRCENAGVNSKHLGALCQQENVEIALVRR